MSDSGSTMSIHDQIKLASEWGYNQEEIIAALKANTKSSDNSKEFDRFNSFDEMLDILNRVSGRNNDNMFNNNHSNSNGGKPGDLMSTSTYEFPSRRNLSVGRSSSFHLTTPRSTRDSHDIVRLLATLEKEKERDRKEVESQFIILKNRINHLEMEKDTIQRDFRQLKHEYELGEQELKDARDEVRQLMDEKIEAAEQLDKLTIQNFRQLQEIHDQKELAEHRKKTYQEEKVKKDEEIICLQKQIGSLEEDLQKNIEMLNAQKNVAQRLEEQNYQLQPLMLLDEIVKKNASLVEFSNQLIPGMAQLQGLYKQLIDTYPSMEQNCRVQMDNKIKKIAEIEEKLNSKNREFQRLQEKCINECCICLNTKPSIVFLPCRHLISCSECYETSDIRECPTCRTSIDNSITVFM